MNYSRIALAAIAATVVDGIYGFLVYGQVIGSEFARYPEIYRSSETQSAYLPAMFVGILFTMFVASYLYAKGYEGGSGMQEGMRFGALLGLLMLGYVAGVDYAMMRIGKRMALYFGLAGLVEWVVVGTVIGLVYKPAASGTASRHAPGV
jgi:hypothetical protein